RKEFCKDFIPSQNNHLKNAFLTAGKTKPSKKILRGFWNLAPRPGLEPGTCGLTVRNQIPRYNLIN
ncbi:hypothetical protein IEM48_001123, partial [Neisseria gonorrhoeae]